MTRQREPIEPGQPTVTWLQLPTGEAGVRQQSRPGVQSKSTTQLWPVLAVPWQLPLRHEPLWHSESLVHGPPRAFSGGATHFWFSQALPDGQGVFAVHSGTAAQATAEQARAPLASAQQMPLAQSCPPSQASVGGVEQLYVHTEPLGLAQHSEDEHSAFFLHTLPSSSGRPETHAELSQ